MSFIAPLVSIYSSLGGMRGLIRFFNSRTSLRIWAIVLINSSSCAEVMVCYFKRVTIITFSFTDTENFFPVSAATTEAALRMLLGKYFGVLGISIESPTTKALILPLTLILVCVSIFIRIFVSLLTMQISAILLIYQIILLIF